MLLPSQLKTTAAKPPHLWRYNRICNVSLPDPSVSACGAGGLCVCSRGLNAWHGCPGLGNPQCKWADLESRSHRDKPTGNPKACDNKEIFWYLPQKYMTCLRTSHGMLRAKSSWPQSQTLKVDNQIFCIRM